MSTIFPAARKTTPRLLPRNAEQLRSKSLEKRAVAVGTFFVHDREQQ
jgi:hypothetical protein